MGVGRTMTFLFTDVEGSTSRWAADPEGMAVELAEHDAVLRDAVEGHGGEVFKHTGDGICATFAGAIAAVEAAFDARARLRLPVRMGLHTGDATARDGDWFGPTLNRVARIMDAGHAGQILCSTTTAALLEGTIELIPLGDYRLKGIERPERIVQVGTGEHPPLRAPPATELPARRDRLIGREQLAADVVSALGTSRLVTLVGPGGVGKTSLALEVAHQLSGGYERTALVDLSVVSEAGAILAAVAEALSLSTAEPASIALALGRGDNLLVVDNCEHLVDGAADLVERLLAACPTLAVLATSREPLEVPVERTVAVEPLDEDDAMTTLFVERAARAGATVAEDELGTVVEICHRLDGLPLAIELAAARLTVLSVSQLADRLDDKLQLLGSSRRRGRDRHRTLRETIDWSHDLLDADERALYRRLAVFNDRFDVDAAIAVAGEMADLDVLDLLEVLHDKSLLVADTGAVRRYRYLESIRDHAWEQLEAANESTAAMQAMATHVGERMATLVEELLTEDETDAAAVLGHLLPLRRRAIEWCVEHGDVDRAVPLVVPFLTMPSADARFVAGAGAVLSIDGALDHPDAPALVALGGLERMFRQDFRAYRTTMEQLHEMLGSEAEIAAAVGPTAFFMARIAGDDDTVLRILDLAAAAGGPFAVHAALSAKAERLARGQPDAPDVDELVELAEGLGSRLLRGMNLSGVARAAAIAAPDRAGEIADRALALLEPGTSAWLGAYHAKAGWHATRGELREALAAADTIVDNARRLGELSALVPPLAVHAVVLQALDAPREAATVRGALPRRWSVFLTRERDELDEWLAAHLSDDELRSLRERGAGLDLDALLSIAPAILEQRRAS